MMPLNRMARSVFFSVFLLGAIDLYAAEQPELVEQKPQYIRTRELPPLKISFADMQSILEKAANLLSDANVNAPKKKEFFFRETLTLGKEPDQIEIAGHSFPSERAPSKSGIPAFILLFMDGCARFETSTGLERFFEPRDRQRHGGRSG